MSALISKNYYTFQYVMLVRQRENNPANEARWRTALLQLHNDGNVAVVDVMSHRLREEFVARDLDLLTYQRRITLRFLRPENATCRLLKDRCRAGAMSSGNRQSQPVRLSSDDIVAGRGCLAGWI